MLYFIKSKRLLFTLSFFWPFDNCHSESVRLWRSGRRISSC